MHALPLLHGGCGPQGEPWELPRLQVLSSEKAASYPRAECLGVTMTGRRHRGGMELVLR